MHTHLHLPHYDSSKLNIIDGWVSLFVMESESAAIYDYDLSQSSGFLFLLLPLLWLQKLDFENPNERKFLLLVVATEEKTNRKLSSSATVTVEVEDLNDNHPVFDKESYTASIPEEAIPGEYFRLYGKC